VNDSSELTNNRSGIQRPWDVHERRTGRSIVLAGEDFDVGEDRSSPAKYVAVWVVLLFWTAEYCGFTAYQALESPQVFQPSFWPRLLTSIIGALVSLGMAAGQASLRDRKLAFRAIAAILFAAAGAAAGAVMAFVVEPPFGFPLPFGWINFVGGFYPRIWVFGSISAIVLAVSYADDIRRREQRISALQALADSAQVRALRNQLNPHFLFNALNSIAGLIAGGRHTSAERMTEDVADFLRVSIAMDAQSLITLGDELRLQDLYLQIEKVRFPDRLLVESDVPDELRTLLVPALITQPLIENSIKYAVARSTGLVRLSIRVRRTDSGIEIVIEDDGGNAAETAPKGAKLGLSNVINRLHAHYGTSASFQAQVTESGGFRNVIVIAHA
jgi:hypothetical protein